MPKQTFRVGSTASQAVAGENGQSYNSNIQLYPVFWSSEENLRKAEIFERASESANQPSSSNAFPNSKSTKYHHKLHHKLFILNPSDWRKNKCPNSWSLAMPFFYVRTKKGLHIFAWINLSISTSISTSIPIFKIYIYSYTDSCL